MESVSLWKQLNEPATKKDLFLIALCIGLGFVLGAVYGAAMMAGFR